MTKMVAKEIILVFIWNLSDIPFDFKVAVVVTLAPLVVAVVVDCPLNVVATVVVNFVVVAVVAVVVIAVLAVVALSQYWPIWN